jgi:hypothetical protein
MKSTTTRGTPYTHIGPSGSNSGYREGGGNATNTVAEQYRGSGINTRENTRGTPAQYEHGNPGDASRVASHGKYGMVESNEQRNANDPANNGDGVILDGADSYARGFAPTDRPTMDSPVPRDAPVFDEGFIRKEDVAHLGRGAERNAGDLLEAGGVMSRGMVGTSKASDTSELELTTDDTLPAVGPAGKP